MQNYMKGVSPMESLYGVHVDVEKREVHVLTRRITDSDIHMLLKALDIKVEEIYATTDGLITVFPLA